MLKIRYLRTLLFNFVEVGPSGRGGNKLRVHKLMKTNFVTENYRIIILHTGHRAAFSKFRCGVETGLYEGLAEDLRLCPFCNVIENEMHCILYFHA